MEADRAWRASAERVEGANGQETLVQLCCRQEQHVGGGATLGVFVVIIVLVIVVVVVGTAKVRIFTTENDGDYEE